MGRSDVDVDVFFCEMQRLADWRQTKQRAGAGGKAP